MLKIFKFSIILLLLINVFFVLSAQAEPLLNPPDYSPGCIDSGNCKLNDFMQIALNVSNIILGIVGSLALLAFIAGGLMWLLSAGKPEMVTRGKQTIIGAVIGLAIVFTSFMIIQLVYASLGLNWKGTSDLPKTLPETINSSSSATPAK